MKFSEVVSQTVAWLQRDGRVSYRALQREFGVDDAFLTDLKAEIIEVHEVAVDKDGKMLVWTGTSPVSSSEFQVSRSPQPPVPQTPNPALRTSQPPTAERRQLTVLFCDLVGSTALSSQLDPEDYRAVVQRYQQTCAEVIQRHAGYLAQYLGDGLLVYFGYPVAQEDDARRAVRTGLEIISAIEEKAPSPLAGEGQGEGATGKQLQVRIGLHTGLVVIGDIGSSGRTEQLALGETPNIAARIQGLAEPNTVIISATTQRLIEGQFESQPLGSHRLKGIDTPMAVYRVQSERQLGSSLAWRSTLTPLVGREEELALLHRRWEQVKDREGQVALLSGEPGIGKSRLVRELRDRAEHDGAVCLEFRCSPYHQNSALQPVIEHLHRVLQWQKDDTSQTKLSKLHTTLTRYRFPQADTLALFATLLSLPQSVDAAPLNLSPQRQKQKTEEALIAWLIEEAERTLLYCAWEDLHWADPSTLELLGMLIDQTPTNRLFVLLTSRPEFTPPWGQHAHFSQLTLSRLGRRQVPRMIAQATGGKTLPTEVVQQIVAKTDGVPLFVEELTKMVMESGLLTETNGHYELSGPLPPLAIPSTLQDSLMARLDRLASVRELAQLGATIGREFSYELLRAVSSLDNELLHTGLQQLVATELAYQRGTPPHASYIFKHALIQDTAYQSLLKSRRQQLHQQIAQVLKEHFPDTKDTQPELLAHHYTEAGLITQAIPYWQNAGARAVQRSANEEAIRHLTKGLELLKVLPETLERNEQELSLQITLGSALMAVKGFASPETERTYNRARELCQQMGETLQLFSVLHGLCGAYTTQAKLLTARELGEQMLSLASNIQEPHLFTAAHFALGQTLFWLGEFALAREHVERGIALYNPQQHRSYAFIHGQDPGVTCLLLAATALWNLGYPDQARKRIREALTLAQELSHSYSLALAPLYAGMLHQFCREGPATQEQAEVVLAFSREQKFPFLLARATILHGWALATQGEAEEGITQICQGMADLRTIGVEFGQSHFLTLLAEAYGKGEQIKEGLTVLAEALDFVSQTEERFYEAELYRLKGELTLQLETRDWRLETSSTSPQTSSLKPLASSMVVQEAEGCFLKAIEVAQQQQAKSLELRATMSLARLWQQQGKRAKGHQMLSSLYNWFTEGFDTKDLQEARSLLEELADR